MATNPAVLNYNTNPTSTITTVERTVRPAFYADSGVPYYHLPTLGMPQYKIMEIVANKYGRQPILLLDAFAPVVGRMRPTNSYVGYRQVGREVNFRLIVVGTLTANGAGQALQRIKIKSETGTGGAIVTVGAELRPVGDRSFIVVAETVDTDGFQILDVKPNDGEGNMSVIAGNSVEFPTNSMVAVWAPAKLPKCEQVYHQNYTGYDEFLSYKLTRRFMEFKRDRMTLQNEILNRRIVPFEISDPENDHNTIVAFYTENEMKEMIRFYNSCNASMLYSEEVLDPSIGALQGAGLVNLIPPDFRRKYTPGQVSSRWWEDLAFEYRINNPDRGDTLDVVLGDGVYQDLMSVLDRDYRPERRTEPIKSGNESEFTFVASPNRFSMFEDVFGVKFRFINLQALNNRALDALPSPKNANISRKAHDIFIFDLSPLGNFNLTTGNITPERDYKINFFCAQNANGTPDSLVDVYKSGLTDQMGNTISTGSVISFEEETVRRIELTYGVEIADRLSVHHYSLG